MDHARDSIAADPIPESAVGRRHRRTGDRALRSGQRHAPAGMVRAAVEDGVGQDVAVDRDLVREPGDGGGADAGSRRPPA
jgi:hypothetical protein